MGFGDLADLFMRLIFSIKPLSVGELLVTIIFALTIVVPVCVLLGYIIIKALSVKVQTGYEGIMGKVIKIAIVDAQAPRQGKSSFYGEIWAVKLDSKYEGQLSVGQSVEIIGMDGLTLIVKPEGGKI